LHILSGLLLALTLAVAAQPALANPKYAAVIMDADTGNVTYARNADAARYPASLTKMMTLYLMFDALKQGRYTMDSELPVSKLAQGRSPSKLGLKAGETIRVEDAILALVTKSANDVATVIAEALGGTETKFALKMTEKAHQLGMRNTNFRNASGLPHHLQKTTARDMALLGRALLSDHPRYYHYFATEQFKYEGRTYGNHNNLLGDYDGVDGIKTGYIRASGFNLAASATRNGRRIIVVVMGGRTAHTRDDHVADLLDRGFRTLPSLSVAAVPAPLPKPGTEGTLQFASVPAPVLRGTLTEADLRIDPGYAANDDVEPDPEEITDEAVGSTDSDAPATPYPSLWGVQVGAFSTLQAARSALNQASLKVPDLMHSGEAEISSLYLDGSNLFRARVSGMTEGRAAQLCVALQQAEMACRVIEPDDSFVGLSRR
jgi:D-alanyl-D-alanine carboxypeptidase